MTFTFAMKSEPIALRLRSGHGKTRATRTVFLPWRVTCFAGPSGKSHATPPLRYGAVMPLAATRLPNFGHLNLFDEVWATLSQHKMPPRLTTEIRTVYPFVALFWAKLYRKHHFTIPWLSVAMEWDFYAKSFCPRSSLAYSG